MIVILQREAAEGFNIQSIVIRLISNLRPNSLRFYKEAGGLRCIRTAERQAERKKWNMKSGCSAMSKEQKGHSGEEMWSCLFFWDAVFLHPDPWSNFQETLGCLGLCIIWQWTQGANKAAGDHLREIISPVEAVRRRKGDSEPKFRFSSEHKTTPLQPCDSLADWLCQAYEQNLWAVELHWQNRQQAL